MAPSPAAAPEQMLRAMEEATKALGMRNTSFPHEGFHWVSDYDIGRQRRDVQTPAQTPEGAVANKRQRRSPAAAPLSVPAQPRGRRSTAATASRAKAATAGHSDAAAADALVTAPSRQPGAFAADGVARPWWFGTRLLSAVAVVARPWWFGTQPIEAAPPQRASPRGAAEAEFRAAEGAKLAHSCLNWGPASPDERARDGAVVALLAATFPTLIDARGRRPCVKWAALLSRAHWHTCAARAPSGAAAALVCAVVEPGVDGLPRKGGRALVCGALAVAQKYRGAGHGRVAVAHLIAMAKASRCARVIVSSAEAAKAFWGAMGFKAARGSRVRPGGDELFHSTVEMELRIRTS